MPNMKDLEASNISQLLAAKTVDASNGVLFSTGATIPPDTRNRTILIGLGGTGMQTIDYVKGVISRRLNPSWKSYIAFIGVDSDSNEIENTKHLKKNEDAFVCTTLPGANDRLHKNAWTPAWHRFVDPTTQAQVPDLNGNGANRTRYVGKIKAHDKMPGGNGVDEQIVAALKAAKGNRLAPLSGLPGVVENYQVYVIGSTCGGTGSGTFLEMPALIRNALGSDKVQIHGLLYLPDTLTSLDPLNAAELEANGYASLKELDYFQGLSMRENYADGFAYNDPACTEISLDFDKGFYHLPYLVGTVNGPAADSAEKARQTIAEFLISLLGQISVPEGAPFLVDSFVNNAIARQGDKLDPNNPFLEQANEHHEFPKRYAAIGFAEAAAPRKIARAYAISKSCKASGIRPVSKEVRDSLVGTNVLLPFREADDYLTASEVTQKSREILDPLKNVMGMIHYAKFSMQSNLNIMEVTWDAIKKGAYETAQYQQMVNTYLANNTTSVEMQEIENELRKAVVAVTKNIQDYVREEGPFAFANLFSSKAIDSKTEKAVGVGAMLNNLMDGKDMATGKPIPWTTPEAADTALAQQKTNILNMSNGVLPGLFQAGDRKSAAGNWVTCYNTTVNAKIIKAKREHFIGAGKKIYELIVSPLTLLADQIKTFGNILVSLSDIYTKHGGSLDSYDTFRDAQDSVTEVNIAAVDVNSYNWLKQKADQSVQTVSDRAFRNAVIDSFFALDDDGKPNRMKWLDVPQDRIKAGAGGTIQLVNEQVPVPARELFDKAISTVVGEDTDISIETFFKQMGTIGSDVNSIAMNIMRELAKNSQPLFHGDLPGNCYHRYVMYPSALDNATVGDDGTTVGAILRNAANSVFPGIAVYGSSDAGSIVMYQMVTPFEIYKIERLSQWEDNYEVKMAAGGKGMFIHGYSPLVKKVSKGLTSTYEQLTTWKDFPAITKYTDAITEKDPLTGNISREGKIRLELKALVQKAKELGVLYQETDINGQFYINRIYCDRSVEQWNVDLTMMQPNEIGLLPMGKDLAVQVAEQNGKTLEGISRRVQLLHGGVFASSVPDANLAWKYAEKVLRKHPQMHQEVKETVEKFEKFAAAIIEYNRGIMQRYNPAKMVKMIQAQVVYADATGAWKLKKIHGGEKLIANLSENSLKMLKMVAGKDYAMITNGMKGYYLYTKLLAAYAQADMKNETIDDSFDFAKRSIEQKMLEGNMGALENGVNAMAFILEEREALEAKDARLSEVEENAQPWESFLTAMKAVGVVDAQTIKDIREFYNRVALAEMM